MKNYNDINPNQLPIHTGLFSDMVFNLLKGLMHTLRYGDKYKRSEAWTKVWGFVSVDRDDDGEVVLLVDQTLSGYPRRGYQKNPYVKNRYDDTQHKTIIEALPTDVIMTTVILPKLHTVVNRFLKMREMTTGERHRWSFNNNEPITDIEGVKEIPTIKEAVALFDYYKFNKKFLRRKDGLPEKLIGVPRSKSDAKAIENARNKEIKLVTDHRILSDQIEKERDRMIDMIRKEYNARLRELHEKLDADIAALKAS